MASSGDHGVSVTTTGGAEWLVCPCNTVSDFPQRCPFHSPPPIDAGNWPPVRLHDPAPTFTLKWPPPTPAPIRLSDEDVKRIAREVVRQLARANHDPGDEDAC